MPNRNRVKRDTDTGRFMNVSDERFKGVCRER